MTTATLPDPRQMTPAQRWMAADRIRVAHDVRLPELLNFNSEPCPDHATLVDGMRVMCQQCGLSLRRHQRTGASWLYMRQSGLLADVVGLGKTAIVGGMLAMCKENGELSLERRCVVICKAAAVLQWRDELRRMLRGIQICAVTGGDGKKKRLNTYMRPWEVCIISDRTLAPKHGAKVHSDGDVAILENFPLACLVYDDIDPMRHHANRTAIAIKKLARRADRVYGLHGTPLQKRITELHSFLEALGANVALGNLPMFRRNFVSTAPQYFFQVGNVCPADHMSPPNVYTCHFELLDENGQPRGVLCGLPATRDRTGRKVRVKIMKEAGVQNVEVLKPLIEPYILRRRAEDVDDVSLPAIQVNHIWTELTTEQRRRYAELREGALIRLNQAGEEEISQIEGMAAFTRGRQICSGLASLDGVAHDSSGKLDEVMALLDGDLSEDKVVVFVEFRDNVLALSRRLAQEHIGHVTRIGNDDGAEARHAALTRFRQDPECRLLVGTTTIEASLNLQVARHMVMVDTILNPARIEQLSGRVRRQGSAYQTVYLHHMFARDTQEDHYLDVLRSEQAVTDEIFNEQSEIFQPLTGRRLLQLIAGQGEDALWR